MGGEGVKRARMNLVLFVAASAVLMVLLAIATVLYTSDEHTVGPETVTLIPGDWIEIQISPQFEWYEVRFHLDMECMEELDIAVYHGFYSLKEDPGLVHIYNESMNDPYYGSTILSTGEWKHDILLECDCGCTLVIDNTPAGQTNQTNGPVRVKYELYWVESQSELLVVPLVLLLIVAVSVPIVTSILWRRLERARLREERTFEDEDLPSGE